MITRYHTLSCPDCKRQMLVAIPSVTRFHCCKNWDVTIELKRTGMLVDAIETWAHAKEELADCVWHGAETPFADNH